MADQPTVCDELGRHCWRSSGLDVPDAGRLEGLLVSVRTCVWCDKETRSIYRGNRSSLQRDRLRIDLLREPSPKSGAPASDAGAPVETSRTRRQKRKRNP